MIDAGELGTVVQLEASHSAPAAMSDAIAPWRLDPAESPAGGMAALGAHEVDTFNYFVGRAKRVTGFSKQLVGRTAIDEATAIVIEYESGPLGYLGTTYFAPSVVTVAAYGMGGERLERGRRHAPVRAADRRGGSDARSRSSRSTRSIDELAEFARCIRDGGRPETGGPEGIEVAAVFEAVVESAATGQAVEISDVLARAAVA